MLENEKELTEEKTETENQSKTETTPSIDAKTVLENLENFKRTELTTERNARLQAERRLEEVERQLVLAKENTVAQVSEPEDSKKFFESPHAETRKVVEDVLKRQTQPLIDELRADKNESKYERLKEKFIKNPKVGDLVSTYEDYVDQAMQGMEVNDTSMLAAITQVKGMLGLGMIQERKPATKVVDDTKTTETKVTTKQPLPSTLSSSSPPSPRPKDDSTKTPELTETDLAGMRIYGWNPKKEADVKEYIKFRDADDGGIGLGVDALMKL